MENNIFRDVTTQLDLNGPILSWVQEPTVESLTFDVDPALPDGSTTFTLSGARGSDNFISFATNKIYTLILFLWFIIIPISCDFLDDLDTDKKTEQFY